MPLGPDDTLPPSDPGGEATRPGTGDVPQGPSALRAGLSLGPYLLRDRIGEGGMGEVWKAEQHTPVRRTVALKLVKAGMDSREVLARFEAERQALALMDHPFIAKVFDAGATELGRPYFAMEYVQGLPITEYCDKRRLDTRQRLELFQRVCQGVQHAHQKSVLHRDLKPSNVLVADLDGQPRPKIIDFGVAKATTRKLTERTMYTSIGQLIGTPEYMSPEQADFSNEDVDTRTDVYSLGVILYELLVGALPFPSEQLRKGGLEGVLRVLREQDPPKPSTRLTTLGDRSTKVAQRRRTEPRRLGSNVRGDLDWIVMRALEKDRNRRYGSPAEFAQDIQRHLENEPVMAGPPSVRYRMDKFVRRHRAGVIVATAAALALVGFALSSNLQAQATARARDRAEEAAARAAAMNDFLTRTLVSADPWVGGRQDATVLQALDRAVEEIDTSFEGQPELEASMREVLGKTYLGLGQLEAATEQIEAALRMRRGFDRPHDLELAQLLSQEARLRQLRAEHEPALAAASEAARIFRQHPADHANELMEAYQQEIRNLLYLQRYAEAESLIALTEPLAPRLVGDERLKIAERFSERADLAVLRDGDAATADSLSQRAYESARAIDPDNAVLGTYLNNAAQYRSRTGDFEGSLALFDEALEFLESHFGTDHPEYAVGLENRGGVLYQLGRADETLAALETVHDIRTRNLGPDHIDVIRTGLNMGTVASIIGDQEKALRIFAELKPRLLAARGADHPDVLAVLRNEGTALSKLGRYDEAAARYREALEMSIRMNGEDHPRTFQARGDLGTNFARAERWSEAEPLLRTAFDQCLADYGKQDRRTKAYAEWLTKLYESIGRESDAEEMRALSAE